jgi:hypothetical protein
MHITTAHGVYFIQGRTQTEMIENRVPRGISGPVRNEVTGGWRKLCNEKLRNLWILGSHSVKYNEYYLLYI